MIAYMKPRLQGLAPDQVTEALRRWLFDQPANLFLLIADRGELGEAALYEEFRRGCKDAEAAATRPFLKLNRAEAQTVASYEPELIQLDGGVSLVYRQCPDSSFFNLVATTDGGLRFDGDSPGRSYLLSQLMCKSTADLNFAELSAKVENSATVLSGFSGKDSLGIKLQCFHENMAEMTTLMRDCLLSPVLPENQLSLLKMQIAEEIRIESDHSANVAIRSFQKALYGNHNYGLAAVW